MKRKQLIESSIKLKKKFKFFPLKKKQNKEYYKISLRFYNFVRALNENYHHCSFKCGRDKEFLQQNERSVFTIR